MRPSQLWCASAPMRFLSAPVPFSSTGVSKWPSWRHAAGSVGGAVAAWPGAARAQQRDRVRRIGVLVGTAADDAIGLARMAAFLQGLGQLDWMVGRNLRMDVRWAAADADHARGYAAELVALAPDVILASSG